MIEALTMPVLLRLPTASGNGARCASASHSATRYIFRAGSRDLGGGPIKPQ